MNPIDLAIEDIKQRSDEEVSRIFFDMLNLNSEEKDTITFAFGLCYQVETELEFILQKAKAHSDKFFDTETDLLSQEMLRDMVSGYRSSSENIDDFLDKIENIDEETRSRVRSFVSENYKQKPEFSLQRLPYFTDKIKVYEALLGKTKKSSFYYRINDIRNALAHHRLKDLSYGGKSLFLREIKEKIIFDYFQTSIDEDASKSVIWNQLSDEDKAWIRERRDPKLIDLEEYKRFRESK